MTDHETELDRLRRQNIELRQSNNIMANCIKNVISNLESPPKSTFQAQWVTEKAIQILRAAVERSENSTATDIAGSDYISKESVKPLVEAAVANHKWHEEYDDYGGYPESDLCELNCKAIAVAKSIGIPAEKEGA